VGSLTHPDDPDAYTGVFYQLMQTCEQLERQYRCHNFAFCFDSRFSLRQQEYPEYKVKRRTERELKESLDPKAQKQRAGMFRQIEAMPGLLHTMGSRNIFGQTKFEADDQIASIVNNNPDTELVIVSADSDLFQLLRPGVTALNPMSKKLTTDESFQAEWGIPPIQWSSVKAWAGCSSDNIEGLRGVGEKTAILWLQGKLKQENKKYALFSDGLQVYTRNKPLVTLPYAGTQVNKLADQSGNLNWKILAEKIGSLNYVPQGISDDYQG